METQSPEARDILARLERVEAKCQDLARLNRWLTTSLLVLPLVALLAGAALQNQDLWARSITAERLVIRDAAGKERITLSTSGNQGAVLILNDREAKPGVRVRVGDDGMAAIHQLYRNGNMSFGWVTPPNAVPSFALRSPEGRFWVGITGGRGDEPPSLDIVGKQEGR